jgi:hypothetical protein
MLKLNLLFIIPSELKAATLLNDLIKIKRHTLKEEKIHRNLALAIEEPILLPAPVEFFLSFVF